ncbi:MAG: PilN domain-containing protein [Phycisphaerales bacterium]
MRFVDLLPERARGLSCVRSRVVMYAAGFPLVVLLNGVGWLTGIALLSADVHSVEREIADIRGQIESFDGRSAHLEKELSKVRGERIAREALAARPTWGGLVRRVSAVVVRHGSLDRLAVRGLGSGRGESGRVGYEVSLNGLARDATALTALLLELEGEGVFDEVSLIGSSRVREDGSDPSVRFDVRCSILGGEG